MTEITPRIYVACLAAYNNGILHGEWIDADQGVEHISEQAAAMLKASPIEDAEDILKPSYVATLKLSSTREELSETTCCCVCGYDAKVPLPAPDQVPAILSI